MTDHPRFEPLSNAPDQAHLGYHGGRLVDSVLRLIDWWQAMRGARRQGVFNRSRLHDESQVVFAKVIEAMPRAASEKGSEETA